MRGAPERCCPSCLGSCFSPRRTRSTKEKNKKKKLVSHTKGPFPLICIHMERVKKMVNALVIADVEA